jgi:hypothetical protein
MDEIAREALHQHWVHAYEEDTPGQKVFRPAAHKLPPSRGRFSFELSPDGSVVFHGIGPADRTQTSTGAWTREGTRLALHSRPAEAPDQVLDIVSVDPDRLVVRK